MNKKFSTLLAAALVAGGLGSSAFAADLEVKTNQYFQLELAPGGIGSGKYLIVGEGAVRDSLALISRSDFESLNDLNKTFWRVTVETQKDANGFVTGTKFYLENKVNGGVALTYAGASEDLSSYYAPGAVVAAGKWEIPAKSYDSENARVTFDGAFTFGTAKNLYDAAAKEAIGYKLIQVGDVIKLAKGTADASDAKSMDDVEALPLKYHSDFRKGDLSFTGARYTDTALALSSEWLNNMANESFTLSFNKDVSSSVTNPFSATSLKAAELPLYTAAVYDWGEKVNGAYPANSYIEALENANKVVKDLNSIKQDAASYVKEVKVALEAEGTPSANILAGAPNHSDITILNNSLTTLKANLADPKVVTDLQAASSYAYNAQGTIDAADDKAEKLDTDLKALNEAIDALVKATSEAITKYDGAVKAFATEIYRPNSSYTVADVDFEDYQIDEKDADAVLAGADVADKFASTANASLIALSTAMPDVISSDKLIDGEGYEQVYAVVGQTDTYVTVDTTYVAEREKYLGIKTMKLNRIGLDANGDRAEKESDIDHYVLVPNVGDLARPAIFKMTVNPTTTSGDLITIIANAPKPTNTSITGGGKTPKWFKDYTNDVNYFDVDQYIVIRTLSGVRVVSVTTPADKPTTVVNNTKITFMEPDLATKINDGDIYFIINKNVANEAKYNKYVVIDPVEYNWTREVSYAKEAYVNVPATQWVVTKNNDNYLIENRDIDAQFHSGKIYAVNEDQMLYSAGRDTFQLVAADAAKEGHVGYKYISEEIQKITDFALSAVNYANVETPYYLTFNGNEDSILTATSNKDEALALIPMIVDGKQVTEEYKLNDENLTKQFYQLIAKDGDDTLYLNIDNISRELVVTKVRPVVEDYPGDNNLYYLQFRSINDQPNAYEVLIGRLAKDADFDTFGPEWKLSYNQGGEAVAVAANTASAFVYDLVDNSTDIYKNFGFEGSTKVIISLNGDAESKVTKIGPFATVKRTGLDETIDADYSLIMDTAYVDHKDNIRYAYYITKPIVAADTAWNAEKFYMVSYADSVAAKRDNDTIKYSQDNLTRIGFVAAKRLGTDSLAITKAVGATATDTLNVTDKLGVTNATFAFAIDENNEEAYRIEVAPNRYVSYLNGILVEGAKEQAQLFNVNATDLTPTENEEISVEDGVQVIGGKGSVTVQGAAGKTVTVYNFQGRALASTTLTSDNQTIAVPAGLVAVSVEGEPEAISVVVK